MNIGNPHEVTIEQIRARDHRAVGSKSSIVYRPLPQDDPKQRKPDITRARTLLGWEPKVGLEEGLAKTVGYFKSKLVRQRLVDQQPQPQEVVRRRDRRQRERAQMPRSTMIDVSRR